MKALYRRQLDESESAEVEEVIILGFTNVTGYSPSYSFRQVPGTVILAIIAKEDGRIGTCELKELRYDFRS